MHGIVSEKLRRQENKLLTEIVAITDQLSRFILMANSRQGNSLTQGCNVQRTWREQARERETSERRSIGRNEERIEMNKARDGRRERRRRERERMRAISGRFWLALSPLAEQLDFISGWC